MRVIPVLDLLGGQIVHAIAGRRDQYRPLVSPLVANASPPAVAHGLRSTFGFALAYLADLDAIAGNPPAVDVYDSVRATGLSLWVDAGLANAAQAQSLAALPLNALVAGLESLPSPQVLGECLAIVGPGRLVFSLDLHHGIPRCASAWSAHASAVSSAATGTLATPEDIVAQAVDCGLERLLVLDLAQVGIDQGLATEPLLARIRHRWPHLELTAGGGIRHARDLHRLADLGCQAALVASALHSGRITRADLAPFEIGPN